MYTEQKFICFDDQKRKLKKLNLKFNNNNNNNNNNHVVLVARISLTLSQHFSLSFIASGRSSGQHPVSSHSCWMYVRAGRPAFARSCVGVHNNTSPMSSSLLLQQCPACLVRLTRIVFVIGGRWPYSWCLVGCCRQDLFKIAIFPMQIRMSTRQINFFCYQVIKNVWAILLKYLSLQPSHICHSFAKRWFS